MAAPLPLSRLVAFDYSALRAQRGIGAKKLRLIMAIIEATSQSSLPAIETTPPRQICQPQKPQKTPSALTDALKEWGVPESYPVTVMPLPVRVLRFCKKMRNCVSLRKD